MRRHTTIIVTLAIVAMLASSAAMAQVAADKRQAALMQRNPELFVASAAAALVPNLSVMLNVAESCGNADLNGPLAEMGLFYIKGISVAVWNRGRADSAAATGRVEFFDVATGRNVRLNFAVAPIHAGAWGAVTPATLSSGAYLVRSSQGITVSVTYTGGTLTSPQTHVRVEKACPTLY